MNEYNHPEIVRVLAYWPVFVMPSTIFVVLAVLALITWRWGRKDEEAQVANYFGRARR